MHYFWRITKMAQEEETQKHSNSISGGGGGFNMGNTGRSSKNQKQKKVPQRGLGVAQLEKIRLEEQQKKDGSIILPSPPPISPARPSNFSVPLPSYQSFSSSVTYPPDFSSPNSMHRPQSSDAVNSVGWQSIPVQGHGNATKMLNSCQHSLERESFGVDTGLSFQSSFHFFSESNPIYPVPSFMQKAQKHLQTSHSSSSSMVNASSLSISSSALSFQTEPPSNQSYHGNYTSVWQEEEKMVGMKRPCPFSVDNSLASSLHCKIPPIKHPVSRSDDQSGSFGNREAHSFCPGNNNSREGPSCSCSILEPNSRKSVGENGVFNGDFLTLAPPATDLTCPNSKFKHPSAALAFNDYDTIVFGSLPYQRNMEDPVLQPAPSVPNPHRPCHSFLPTTVMQTGQATKTFGDCNGGEVGENVDLNLKL